MQELTRRGEAVSRGQVVLTGSFAGVLELPFGSDLRITFGGLGVLRVEFSAAESASCQLTE
jgi:2-keto-4-pentenoate hydratase